MASPKILIYDIETCHNIVAAFQLKVDYIHPQNILQERHLVSVAWKWLGEKVVHSFSLLDDPKRFAKNPHDDTAICLKLHQLFSEADIIVAHNGDKFDKKIVEGRMFINGLDPLPQLTTIDTLKVARKRFNLNAYNLNYLGKILGIGSKIHVDNTLWLQVLNSDVEAIKKMVKYNKGDIVLLEKVFLKLRPYITNIPTFHDGHRCTKPGCGSKKLQSRGVARNATRVYQRFQCQVCGGWSRALKSEKTSLEVRAL